MDILYLHGYHGNPESSKAQKLKTALVENFDIQHFWNPVLPIQADEIIKLAIETIQNPNDTHLIGSSLGAFFARYLVENAYAKAAILINPCLNPQHFWYPDINWRPANRTKEEQESLDAVALTPQVVRDSLMKYRIAAVKDSSRYLLLLRTGDATIHYQNSLNSLPDSPNLVLEGGNHSFDDIELALPEMQNYLNHF